MSLNKAALEHVPFGDAAVYSKVHIDRRDLSIRGEGAVHDMGDTEGTCSYQTGKLVRDPPVEFG